MRPATLLLPALLLILAVTSGCSFPRLYRATIQQGNVITQEMVDKLEPGMTRSQVAFIMGEPILRSPFVADRWVYLYRVEIPGRYEDEKRLTLYFEEDLLAYFTGDFRPGAGEPSLDQPAADDTAPDDPPV